MSARRTAALLLAAGLLVAGSFSLPWAVPAWQDRAQGGQATQYQATPLADTGLLDHLKLAAQGYTKVPLDQTNARLTASQALEAAREALGQMDGLGLTFLGQEALFDPAAWEPLTASPFVAVSTTAVTYAVDADDPEALWGQAGDRAAPQETATVAVFWACTFPRSGEELTLILDDETGKMLSFSYSVSPTDLVQGESLSVSPTFSMEDAQRMMAFCQQYYGLDPQDFGKPVYFTFPGYFLPLKDAQGGTVNLPLTANTLPGAAGGAPFVLAFNDSASYVSPP